MVTSILIMILGVIGVIISGIGLNKSKLNSTLVGVSVAGILLSVILTFGTFMYNTLDTKRTETIFTIPKTVTKTDDGYTIATYGNMVVTSDKASVWNASTDNISIRTIYRYNHWNIKLSDVSVEVVKTIQ